MSEENSSKRIDELEVKFTLQEDLIDQLNKIVTEQQFMIDKLQKELAAIKTHMEDQPGEHLGDPMDEKPPHY